MCSKRPRRRLALGLALASAAATALPVQAAPAGRKTDREAAYLQEAFGHDLCTRNDRELRRLNKALSRTPAHGAH